MHSFSVDFLTGSTQQTSQPELRHQSSHGTGSDGTRTPSPESRLNTVKPGTDDPDVVSALRDLEKQAANQPHLPEKPPLSYIALISMAVLSSPERKLLLSDIYQWIMDNFEYYNNREKAWRNSIRHNLSLNECFVKVGRSQNGKGHFWAVHPACVDDFSRGDYRRRHARRRAKRNNQQVDTPPIMYGYMPTPHSGFTPYASPLLSYYPSAMSAMSVSPGMSAVAPLSPGGPYPHFPVSMMPPFSYNHTAMNPWM